MSDYIRLVGWLAFVLLVVMAGALVMMSEVQP